MAAEKPTQAVETAPDPDEDDLDDLDDVLDQFQATKLETPHQPAPTASGPGRPTSSGASAPAAVPDLSNDEDEFAKQLQAGMADLLGDLDSDPAMKKQFEELMKGIDVATARAAEDSATQTAAASSSRAPSASEAGAQSKPGDPSFQDTIRKTMERLQTSGDAAGAAATSSSEDDILAQMLKEMEAGGFGGEGSDDDFSKMLMGMMEQLTNKDILYEPMKELHDKFPEWMEKNKSTVAESDLKRYEEQQGLVSEIVARFERPGYTDQDAGDREYIVERMQKMQAAGSPPPDLVGDMNAAQEAMGELDAGCPTQ